MAVFLHNIDVAASKLDPGKYRGEDLMKHFRYFYGDKFTSHDLSLALKILGWKKTSRGSGRGFYVSVKQHFI